VRLAVKDQIDGQHRHDEGEQRSPGKEWHVDVDERLLGSGGSKQK
jgi:hypothetical protein